MKRMVMWVGVALMAVGATAQAGPMEGKPTREILQAALDAHLKAYPEACYSFSKWPIEIGESAGNHNVPNNPLTLGRALVKIGFAKEEQINDFIAKPGARPARGVRFVPTDAAAPYLKELPIAVATVRGYTTGRSMHLCYGKIEAGNVLRSVDLIAMNPEVSLRVERVAYEARITDVAPWANDPEIQHAMDLRRVFKASARSVMLHLTKDGWTVEP